MSPELVGPLDIGPVAHGGHCVARFDGRVIFVRHAIPGEKVMVAITDDSKAAFWRGDAVEIIDASPDRVVPPCPVAGQCGGCDFQHVSLPGQRALKAAVVREQVAHLAGIEWLGEVEDVGPVDGLGWRTRMRYLGVEVDGVDWLGMRAHRSHDVVPIPLSGCPIAAPGVDLEELALLAADSGREVGCVVPSTGRPRLLVDGRTIEGSPTVTEQAAGRRFRVPAGGFWQVHPRAADVLVDAVVSGLAPRAGETALDLYCGVGLFAGALADEGAKVTGVELDRRATREAAKNVPGARFIAARLEKALDRLPRRTDLVVLDPPRTGAGAGVIGHIVGLRPRAIAPVACDPAALGRDLATYARQGWRLESLRAFDLFPMTHHVECVAILLPAST